MIQQSVYTDGSFVLHKVPLNGQTYSAWYGSDGVLFSADRTTNWEPVNVPLGRQTKVAAELQKIGLRYLPSKTTSVG